MQPFHDYYAAECNRASYKDNYLHTAQPNQPNHNEKQVIDDMEVEDAYSNTGDYLQSPIEMYPATERIGHITSSPRSESFSNGGMQPPLPDYTPEKAPPPPDHDPSESPLTRASLTSIEVGDLLERAEMKVKQSKLIDTYLAQGSTAVQCEEDTSHRNWWNQEPLSTSSGILYLTYTPPPTVQEKLSIADIFRYSANDLDREPWKTDSTSWYDPLYGDLSAPTGTYDAIKEILKKKKKRGKRKSFF